MKKILLTVMGLLSLTGYAQLPIETFESPWVGTPAAPPGWTVVNQEGPVITWRQSTLNATDYPAFAGNHSAYLQRESVSPTATIPTDWLITPAFTVPEFAVLQFYSRLTLNGDQGGTYKIMISTDPDATNLNAYTELYNATELELNSSQLTYMQKAVSLPATTVPARLAFVMTGNNADSWLIDNVSVVNSCAVPTNINVTAITATEATINWQENGIATSWEIELVQANAIASGVPTAVASVSPFVLSALAPGDYKVYVRSICPDGGKSMWAGPVFFSTRTNVVEGAVKYDISGSGNCNAESPGFANVEVKVSINGVFAYSIYTDGNGNYRLHGLPNGETTLSLQVILPTAFGAVAPLEQVVVFSEEQTEQAVTHCITQANPVNDLKITLTPSTSARPGVSASYYLEVRNVGTTAVSNASIALTYNLTKMTYSVSTFASALNTDNTVNISIGTIAPLATVGGFVNFDVLPPPANIGGTQLHFYAVLSDVAGDITPENNTATLYQTVVNSYDPNDITVHQGAEIYLDQAQEEYLTYTIRFQNTGTAEALDIKLENTLSDLLDPETFEPLTSSHDYIVKRTGSQLTFEYKGINLPHSSANEPGSHGFVTYKVKAKSTIDIGDIVSNTAEIYFDFNEAIITNTATTEIVWVLDTEEHKIAIATLYPNPVKDQLQVDIRQGVLQSVTVHDINGRLCLSANATTINTSALNSGIYFVKVTTDAGSADYKIIKH